ncbi:GATOR complex protein NPRL3 [Chionoecetes opilio]|uniref:GATOR complex protein NPRL3 n=1 Tax=Chionoecetes opilio TaxID=41210 RepID=A0A8J5D102_CHIOP|nr:GATOR complex protein NPRL3 [Chionoecetes opilio]
MSEPRRDSCSFLIFLCYLRIVLLLYYYYYVLYYLSYVVLCLLCYDFLPVCSDERSPSPGVTLGAAPQLSVHHTLDAALTPQEKEMLMKVEAAQSLDDLKLFAKLCVYFRGCHHLEEMMFRANLRRSQLLYLIEKFRPVLTTCQHPDDSITLFSYTK